LPNPSPEVVILPRPALADEFVRRCLARALPAIAARGRFAMAIPGGSVAEAFLPPLGRAALEWDRIDIFWCDERAVPADDPRSNFGLARTMFAGTPAATKARMHPMTGGPELERSANEYARTLNHILGQPPVLDLVLLGVGEEGHVCSLFPGSRALDERSRWVLPVEDAPKPPPRRLTLTLPVLDAARAICVAAFGMTKAKVIADALTNPVALTPVARVLSYAHEPVLLLDPESASGL
jgi:6-phosphogluconolactonase